MCGIIILKEKSTKICTVMCECLKGRAKVLSDVKTCIEVGDKSVSLIKNFKNWRSDIAIQKGYIETAKKALGIELGTYRVVHNAIKRNGEPRVELRHADIRAMKAISSLDLGNAIKNNSLEFVNELPSEELNSNMYTVSSVISDAYARVLFDYVPADEQGYLKYEGRLIDFPMRMICDKDKLGTINIVRDKSIHVVRDDGIAIVPNWGVIIQRNDRDDDILYPQYDAYTKFIIEDYLMITRIPNFMNTNALEQNKSIVITGGTHAEGTVAIENLLKDKKLLAKIGKMLCDKKIDEDILYQRPFGLQMLFKVKVAYNKNDLSATKATIKSMDIVGEPIIFNRGKESWEYALKEFYKIHQM